MAIIWKKIFEWPADVSDMYCELCIIIFWVLLFGNSLGNYRIGAGVQGCLCVCVCAKLLQSCPTLGNPMDCSPSDFCVHGNLQARITGVGCHAHTLWLRDPRKLTNSYTVQIRIVMIYLMSIDQTGYFRARQFATLEMNDDGFVQATTVKVPKR